MKEERQFKFGTFSLLTVAASLVTAQNGAAGLYTAAQATRGAALYAEKCAVCHGARLEGGAGSALFGTSFTKKAAAQNLTVKSLLDVMSSTMPSTAPASLKQEEYEALVAFVLQANGYAAGDTPLRKDSPELGRAKLGPSTSAGALPASRPASIGAYTEAQAARGKSLYSDNCLTCHGGDLGGVEDAPPLAGRTFMSEWTGESVGAIYARIDKTMPPGNGGSVGPVGDADIVAYILSRNNYPSGSNPLPSEIKVLSAIIMDKPPATGN